VPHDELFTPAAAEKAKADTSIMLPSVSGPICASHPRACQALADEAMRLGADLVRGVIDLAVQAGTRPSIASDALPSPGTEPVIGTRLPMKNPDATAVRNRQLA
jgi:hypothetical protein